MLFSEVSQFVRREDLFASDIDDELVMLDEEGDSYYGFNSVARKIWGLLERPTTLRELQQKLLDLYEVDAGQCQQETIHFLESLLEKRLINLVVPA